MKEIEALGLFYLGRTVDDGGAPYLLDARDLTTHAVIVGMTGSGKTGLGVALLEEAALDGVPALVLDPKGDLGNLALAFPALEPADFEPWVDRAEAERAGQSVAAAAAATAERWRRGLEESGQESARVARFRAAADVALFTPGSRAGRPLSVLRSFAAPPAALGADPDALRERASAAVSGLLALLGRDADPLRSREHILLAHLVDEAWQRGASLDLPGLIRGLESPPFSRVGALELESFLPARDRFELGSALNNLLASPAFAPWLEGEPLEIGRLLRAPDGRPRLSVLSIAHLGDAERMFFVTLLLNEVVAWMRSQPGTPSLRALLYMDEVFGYLPPTAQPPSKAPLLTLVKQARAYGLGVVLATQNPVDLDYKALSNAGTWFLGRLQTERDRARVVDGLERAQAGAGLPRAELERQLANLPQRVFLARSARDDAPVRFRTRYTLSYLRGPLTRDDLRRLREAAEPPGAAAAATPSPPAAAPHGAAGPAAPAPRGADGERPLLPPGVDQVFLKSPAPGARYAPALYAEARLHFVAARDGLDVWRDLRVAVPFEGDAPRFEAARSLGPDEPVSSLPVADARFAPLPGGAVRPARYTAWGRELKSWLLREQALVLPACAEPRLVARPGESEGELRARVAERLHEERDRALDALRAKYARRLEQAQARSAAARARLEREGSELRGATFETAVSVGASLLDTILGRGRRRSLGGAARAAGRTARQRGDVSRAEDTLAEAEEARLALEREADEALAALRERYRPEALALTQLRVAPRKADLSLERVALGWEPVP
jgi:DNA helicase HerA-like ATPase